MYLELSHGRNSPEDDMADWGFDGPIIGPLDVAHVTYLHQLRVWNRKIANGDAFLVMFYEDMVVYDGKYYGDWCFIDKCHPSQRNRVVPLDKAKLELF